MIFKKRNCYTTEAQAKDLIPVFQGCLSPELSLKPAEESTAKCKKVSVNPIE